MPELELKAGPVANRIKAYNTNNPNDEIKITGKQSPPAGLYHPCNRQGQRITFSGFGSRNENGIAITGRIEAKDEYAIEKGKLAAKGACLNFLNNLAIACDGELDEIHSIEIRVDVYCDEKFDKLPAVADGASELLVNVFGEFVGKGTRTTSGSSELPGNMSVEISGEVHITKKLAKSLDLEEAKNLAKFLTAARKLDDTDKISFLNKLYKTDEIKQLTKEIKFQLYQCATEVIDKLSNLKFAKNEENLINQKNIAYIRWVINHLNLPTQKPTETHSTHGFFSSITKESVALVAGTAAFAATAGYVLGKIAKR